MDQQTTAQALIDYSEDEGQKYYTISERYFALRVKQVPPEQAYRIAKGLINNEKINPRTLQYQERKFRNFCLDPRKLPEIQAAATKAYQQILSGKGRQVEKVLKDGTVVKIREKPPMAVIADLAKDALEHKNPTVKAVAHMHDITVRVFDMGAYE